MCIQKSLHKGARSYVYLSVQGFTSLKIECKNCGGTVRPHFRITHDIVVGNVDFGRELMHMIS